MRPSPGPSPRWTLAGPHAALLQAGAWASSSIVALVLLLGAPFSRQDPTPTQGHPSRLSCRAPWLGDASSPLAESRWRHQGAVVSLQCPRQGLRSAHTVTGTFPGVLAKVHITGLEGAPGVGQ